MIPTKINKEQMTGEQIVMTSIENENYSLIYIPPKIYSDNQLFELKANRYCDHYLEKGKYDIDYVINLLKIIMQKCEQMRMNPKDLQFTLWTSTQKLLSMLEVERDQK
jgi:hypothetical protein